MMKIRNKIDELYIIIIKIITFKNQSYRDHCELCKKIAKKMYTKRKIEMKLLIKMGT